MPLRFGSRTRYSNRTRVASHRTPTVLWASGGAMTGVTISAPTITTTFNSIGVYVPIVEAGGTVPAETSYVEFRVRGSLTSRASLPLWPVRPAVGEAALCGSLLFLTHSTEYELLIHLFDNAGNEQKVFTRVTTRVDAIPSHAALLATATRYVRADGSDANNGQADTSGGAWATIAQAMTSAPSGAVVKVGAGYYAGHESAIGSGGRSTPITFVSAFPAVDDARARINAGNLSVIEGGVRSGPAANGVVTEAPWVSTDLTGPIDGLTHTVWKWTNVGSSSARTALSYGSTRAAQVRRAAHWRTDAIQLGTAAGWAELLDTNLTYRYGFYQLGTDLFVKLPGGVDPNTLWFSAGTGCGFAVNAADCRFSGFVIRGFEVGVQGGPSADRLIVDHCDIQCARWPVNLWGTAPSSGSVDTVVQYNLTDDTTMRGPSGVIDTNNPPVPWNYIKTQIKKPDGSLYASTKLGAAMEGTGVTSVSARRVVVRYNTIRGGQNGVGTLATASFDRFAASDWDIHDNVIRDCSDDAFEPEQQAMNRRIWNNDSDYSNTALSTGPVNYGPIYLVNCVFKHIGLQGMAYDLDAIPSRPGTSSIGFKYSRASAPQCRIYGVNLTLWSDDTDASVSGGGQSASGSSLAESFRLWNCIFRMTRNAFEFFNNATHNFFEDYNQFVTSDATRGLKLLSPSVTYLTWASYRAAQPSYGQHSNLAIPDLHDTTTLDAQFTNLAAGDLNLIALSVLRGRGVLVPNVNDQAGTRSIGAAL